MNNSNNASGDFTLAILGLPDDGTYEIIDVEIKENIKYVHVGRPASPRFCDICGSRMHSKGLKTRHVNHPVLQDTTTVVLLVHQRGWTCKCCNTFENETFPFLQPYKQSTSLTFFMVCEAMKDLNRSTASIAEQFHMSDTQVHDIFTAHVDVPALPLPEFMSIDEVYINLDKKHLYAFVIMDFISGEIVDIVENRWNSTLENYFYNIPLEERNNVKVIISDAYKPYIDFPEHFFPNARSVLDSFHCIKLLLDKIKIYINGVLKKYKERDKKRLEEKNHDFNLDNDSIKPSREVILLRDFRWVLLKNEDNIYYSTNLSYNSQLQMNVDTRRIEDLFMELDSNFRRIRELKEKYIEFNSTSFEKEEDVKKKLDQLITEYEACDIYIFKEFARFLKKYTSSIVSSFTTVEVSRKTKDEIDNYYSRLSNGPMESFNRKPKDYKRNSRGSSNFDYTRNRILWSTRKNPPYLGIPKTFTEVHSYRRKKRGKYKKKKKN